jgi:hypothetical protein
MRNWETDSSKRRLGTAALPSQGKWRGGPPCPQQFQGNGAQCAPYERLFWGALMKKPPARMDRWPQRRREAGRKPSSVPGCPGDDHSSMTPVTRGLQQPTRELRAGHPQTLPYLVLLQVGFSKPAMSPLPLVSSYLTLSPLPWTYHGGLVSEALSLGLPPLGITQHPALWSSDFPPAAQRRPAIIWPASRSCGGITNQQLKDCFCHSERREESLFDNRRDS